MSDGDTAEAAWFAGLDPDDVEGAVTAIREGQASDPAQWPAVAVERGFAETEAEYYDRLHDATVAASQTASSEREQADDQQLIHAVRAMDDCDRQSNELAERVAEWAGSLDANGGTGVSYARSVAERDPETATERRVVGLASRAVDLADEAASLREHVEQTAPQIAPNLSSLAGSVLAARLIERAGGLETLAKQPSGTVQVLGAEDALFAHLQGSAPSPKHGVIFTHEAVRETAPERRGAAARALAGKLSIAARIDHYSGDRRPKLATELADRIQQIRTGGDA